MLVKLVHQEARRGGIAQSLIIKIYGNIEIEGESGRTWRTKDRWIVMYGLDPRQLRDCHLKASRSTAQSPSLNVLKAVLYY